MKPKKKYVTILVHALIIGYLVFLLFPLFWVVTSSVKPTQEIYSGAPTILPQTVTTDHYISIFREQRMLRSMGNSLIVGVLSTILVIVLAVPSAYALARYKSALNNLMLGWILTTQIFPVILVMIPLYVLLRRIGLTDSLTGLTLVYVVWALPFVLWMLHGYMKSVPVELEEAATIDGASGRR